MSTTKRLSGIASASVLSMIALFAMTVSSNATDLPANKTAELIIVNASVRTMDTNKPLASALATSGNQILAVGDEQSIRSLSRTKTRVIDAKGKLVLPGFNDAHVHLMDGGFSLASIDLRDAATPDEFVRRLGEFARKLPEGQWITGGNWDHEKWPGAQLPTKEMIDKVTPKNPVFINRTDGHMCLANSLTLKLAGITRETKDVPGGLIVRNASGEPTGILKDAAMGPVWKIQPQSDPATKMAAAQRASDYAAQLGITTLQDMSANADVEIYRALNKKGDLKCRIYCAWPLPRWEEAKSIRASPAREMVRIGAMKGFADGSIGSATAYFFQPYLNDPKNRGLLADQMFPQGTMLQRVLGADKAGMQVLIHAIGDQANKEILDIYQETAKANGNRDRRFRIEHAQHLRTEEILRFAKQGVIASMQPYHAIDDGRWCEAVIGTERARGTYAFRSLLDAGAVLAFGTDWTVAPLNPMLGIYAAVTRRTLDNKHPNGWVPEQKISVEEAVRAYTVGSAYAEFSEQVKGTLTPGKLADLVILDQNIFEIDPVAIQHVKPVLTMVDGRVVYESK